MFGSGGNTINITGTAGGEFVYDSSTASDTVNVSGNGQTGSVDTINIVSGSEVIQTGVNVKVVGTGNTITASTNDTVTIGSGSETLIAGTGGDIFTNTGGNNNIYEFASGFGADTIKNASSAETVANGTVDFLGSLTDENLWFQKSGNNLLVDQLGTSNQITLTNWYTAAKDDVSSFTASGQTLDSQIAALVSAMASYATANPGFNPTTATDGMASLNE
jgi:hypothetical protein